MRVITKVSLLVILLTFFLTGLVGAEDRYRYLCDGVYLDTQTLKHCPLVSQDYYIKPELIETDDGYADAWIKITYDEEKRQGLIDRRRERGSFTKGFERLDYMLVHWQVKTSRSELKDLQQVYYDTAGNVIDSYETPTYYQKWESTVPNSIGEECQKQIVAYLKLDYSNKESEQRKQKELAYLRQRDDLVNQFQWIASDDKRTYFFDKYSVKFFAPGVMEVRTRVVFNTAGIEELITNRKNDYFPRNIDGFETLSALYKHYLFNIKTRQYKNKGWLYLGEGRKVLDIVYMPLFLDKWSDIRAGSYEEKLANAIVEWAHSNNEFVKNNSLK